MRVSLPKGKFLVVHSARILVAGALLAITGCALSTARAQTLASPRPITAPPPAAPPPARPTQKTLTPRMGFLRLCDLPDRPSVALNLFRAYEGEWVALGQPAPAGPGQLFREQRVLDVDGLATSGWVSSRCPGTLILFPGHDDGPLYRGSYLLIDRTGDAEILAGRYELTAERPQGAPQLPRAPLAKSMKGWELYSWEENGQWQFTLLQGTNRFKEHDEVFGPNRKSDAQHRFRVSGLNAIKSVISLLPSGEQVFWVFNRSWKKNRHLASPPQPLADDLKAHAQLRGVQIHD